MPGIRKAYYLFILISFIFCFTGCTFTSEIEEKKYCGIVMKPGEIADVDKRGKDYEYSDNDMEIHSEIAYFAQEIGGDSVIIEVFFFLSNKKELGVYLNGPNDPKIIHSLTCAIIDGKYKNNVPPKKYILYYNDSTNKLQSAIKSPDRSKPN